MNRNNGLSFTLCFFLALTAFSFGAAVACAQPLQGRVEQNVGTGDVFSAGEPGPPRLAFRRRATGALEDCLHFLSNESGAPYAIEMWAAQCDEQHRNQFPAPNHRLRATIEECWQYFNKAIAEFRIAEPLLKARSEACQPHFRAATAYINQGRDCINRVGDADSPDVPDEFSNLSPPPDQFSNNGQPPPDEFSNNDPPPDQFNVNPGPPNGPPNAPPPNNRPWPGPQPSGTPTTSAPVQDTVCNLQKLAAMVFRNYASPVGPISTVRVTNSASPTYLVLLSGMDAQKIRNATLAGDVLLSWLNVQALDAYTTAILDAVKNLPPGSKLILAGHSQGGMEAQNAVEKLRQLGFEVPQVIAFGAPVSTSTAWGTHYLFVRAQGDPVADMDRRYAFAQNFVRIPGGSDLNPFNPPYGSHHIYPQSYQLLQTKLPAMSFLQSPCLEIDLSSYQQYAAPSLFSRAFHTPMGPYPDVVSTCPRNPDKSENNCLWAAIAQDRYLATGGELKYWAADETQNLQFDQIKAILRRTYGENNGDPQLTTRQQIEDQLRAGGNGSRGIVLWGHVPLDDNGHIFNARNINGQIQFWDAQNNCDAAWYFGGPSTVYFYRTK